MGKNHTKILGNNNHQFTMHALAIAGFDLYYNMEGRKKEKVKSYPREQLTKAMNLQNMHLGVSLFCQEIEEGIQYMLQIEPHEIQIGSDGGKYVFTEC